MLTCRKYLNIGEIVANRGFQEMSLDEKGHVNKVIHGKENLVHDSSKHVSLL